MKLSIIVPVYKVEAFLPRCIDSLFDQTIEDYEIILVDDGSPDASGKICDDYAAKHPDMIKVLHIDNGGQGRARNFALDIAKGEYVGFVDSDDWLDTSMYKKMLSLAEEKNADVVVCDFLEKYDDGRENYLPACFQSHWLSSSGSSCNKIFRRELVAELRFPTGLWYEDFYFSAVMLMRSKHTEFIKEPLYIYRQCDNSTMRNNNAVKNLDMLEILNMLEDYMLPNGFGDDFEFFVLNHVILDSINRLARQNNRDAEDVITHFRAFAHEKIPKLSACRCYHEETRNRRIIMRLNYMGLHRLSKLILNAKKAL